MNRAASTWQYNVVCDLVERHQGGRRSGFFPSGDDFVAHDRAHADNNSWQVLKAHNRHAVYAAALNEGRALAIYSYRDLRDLAYSLMHKCSASFDQVVLEERYLHICLENDSFWTAQPRTLCQRYECIVDDLAGGVCELAIHLGIVLENGEAEALAERYSLEANRGRATELADQLRARGVNLADPANTLSCDPDTQIHWNHIQDGRVDVWRERATPREVALLAGICGEWLIARGYEPDYRWAESALAQLCRELGLAQQALGQREQELAEQAQRLTALEQMGPVALGMARQVHRLSLRFPRVSSAVRRLVSLKG
jgi:hypothetical protein